MKTLLARQVDIWPSRECSLKQSRYFTKTGSSSNVFSDYTSPHCSSSSPQCSSVCLFGNSTDKNALLQIRCLSVTWHRKSLCSSQYFWTLYSLRTSLFLIYSLRSSWKFLYKTGKNKSSVAFFLQSWCKKIWNGFPSELHKLRKAPFKRKLLHLLLKLLEIEEMNVDTRYINLSSLYLYFNWLALSLTC